MKNFLLDLCLVLLLMCVIALFFDDYNVSQTMFERSIDDFENTVDASKEINQNYVTLQDNKDNQVSLFMKKVSDKCIVVIEFIVMIFSNFISMILTVMVY